jgi:hypothetical protein
MNYTVLGEKPANCESTFSVCHKQYLAKLKKKHKNCAIKFLV